MGEIKNDAKERKGEIVVSDLKSCKGGFKLSSENLFYTQQMFLSSEKTGRKESGTKPRRWEIIR